MTEEPAKESPSTTQPLDISGNRIRHPWTREQEELMAGWADIAACYRWMHDRYEKLMSANNLYITIPVIVLSTVSGSANFMMNGLLGNDMSQKYVQIGIGVLSMFTGILTTMGNFFRFAQNSESNRVASISWGKLQRQIAVELALHPKERIDSRDFLKITRAELDRLIEQSPPIPDRIIAEFEREFVDSKDLKKPDIAHGIEHTHIFVDSKGASIDSILPAVNAHLDRRLLTHTKAMVLDLEGVLRSKEKAPASIPASVPAASLAAVPAASLAAVPAASLAASLAAVPAASLAAVPAASLAEAVPIAKKVEWRRP
jgi:hypothetical protein